MTRYAPKMMNRSLRLGDPRPEDENALRRLALRLGADPDAETAPAPQQAHGAQNGMDRAEALTTDPELRMAAAIGKCEGMIEGRAVMDRLSAMADKAESEEEYDALQLALSEARQAAETGCGCPHKSAGFASVVIPKIALLKCLVSNQGALRRSLKLKEALREVLADEIDDARQEGASAEEAAGLLLLRRDLLGDLPIQAFDLAQMGREIAIEAQQDPELAEALNRVAASLDGGPSEPREPS